MENKIAKIAKCGHVVSMYFAAKRDRGFCTECGKYVELWWRCDVRG